MRCTKPIRIFIRTENNPYQYPDGLEVPCGKCTMCRIAKRTEWTTRMLHELDYHENSSFVTLTYDEEHLPSDNSLKKRALQNFIKRLRKRMAQDNRKIKYFACGEYGDKTERPHYHLIIFGLGLNDYDKSLVCDSWPFCDWKIDSIYKNSFGLAEPDSIRYVAQYIDKQYSGELAEKEYKDKGREPVFRLMSNGLGKHHVLDNKDQYRENKFLSVNGVRMAFPRYYLDKMELSREDKAELVEKAREKEIELVEKYTGNVLDRNDSYHELKVGDIIELEHKITSGNKQRQKNVSKRNELKSNKKL